MKPSVRIYGVEAAACPSMVESIPHQSPIKAGSHSTIADGIAVKQPGEMTFQMVQTYVDHIVTVDDLEISRTMLYLLERSKLLVEGSGAVSLGSSSTGRYPSKGRRLSLSSAGATLTFTSFPASLNADW